jgi:hypothetical protein
MSSLTTKHGPSGRKRDFRCISPADGRGRL